MFAITPKFDIEYAGASLRVYHASNNEGLPKHSHEYSHATICMAGSIKVTKEKGSLIMTKDSKPINLLAGEWHEIEAVEDGTVFANMFESGKY